MKKNVNLNKVVIGHCSDTDDVSYLEDLLKCGCFLGFDRIYTQCEEQAKTLFELISNGWEDKILLSHDYYVFIDSKDYDWNKQKELISNSERSYTTISKVLLPMLENMGISKVQIKKLMHDNPLSLLNSD